MRLYYKQIIYQVNPCLNRLFIQDIETHYHCLYVITSQQIVVQFIILFCNSRSFKDLFIVKVLVQTSTLLRCAIRKDMLSIRQHKLRWPLPNKCLLIWINMKEPQQFFFYCDLFFLWWSLISNPVKASQMTEVCISRRIYLQFIFSKNIYTMPQVL